MCLQPEFSSQPHDVDKETGTFVATKYTSVYVYYNKMDEGENMREGAAVLSPLGLEVEIGRIENETEEGENEPPKCYSKIKMKGVEHSCQSCSYCGGAEEAYVYSADCTNNPHGRAVACEKAGVSNSDRGNAETVVWDLWFPFKDEVLHEEFGYDHVLCHTCSVWWMFFCRLLNYFLGCVFDSNSGSEDKYAIDLYTHSFSEKVQQVVQPFPPSGGDTNLIEKTSASCIEQSIMSSKRLQKTKNEALGKRTSTVQTAQDRICVPEVPGIGSSI